MNDKDYFDYKRAMGKWTTDQELLWDYLQSITELLTKISQQLGDQKPEDEMLTGIPLTSKHNKNVNLGFRPD